MDGLRFDKPPFFNTLLQHMPCQKVFSIVFMA